MTDDRSEGRSGDEESLAPNAEPSDADLSAATAPVAEPSDPRVAAAVDRLDELAAKDPAEHVEIYEQVHRDLQDALADAADERAAAAADEPDDRGGG